MPNLPIGKMLSSWDEERMDTQGGREEGKKRKDPQKQRRYGPYYTMEEKK